MTEEPLEELEEESDLWQSLEEEEDEEGVVFFVLQESTGYMAPTLRALAVVHTVISFVCVVGYYCLKVSHLIFTPHCSIVLAFLYPAYCSHQMSLCLMEEHALIFGPLHHTTWAYGL